MCHSRSNGAEVLKLHVLAFIEFAKGFRRRKELCGMVPAGLLRIIFLVCHCRGMASHAMVSQRRAMVRAGDRQKNSIK